MKSHRKLSKNCCMYGKNRKMSGLYNFWTPTKSSIPDVWNWNGWTLFSSEIEYSRGHGPPAPSPTSPPLQWLRLCQEFAQIKHVLWSSLQWSAVSKLIHHCFSLFPRADECRVWYKATLIYRNIQVWCSTPVPIYSHPSLVYHMMDK